jgi:hypothetical protein
MRRYDGNQLSEEAGGGATVLQESVVSPLDRLRAAQHPVRPECPRAQHATDGQDVGIVVARQDDPRSLSQGPLGFGRRDT